MQNSRNCSVIVSNCSDKLISSLAENLFVGSPFGQKIVIVSNQEQKNEVLTSFATSKEWGVCAGLQFYSIQQFLSSLLLRSSQEKKLLSFLELTTLLEYEIRCVLTQEVVDPLFLPLFKYVMHSEKKKEGRIISACRQLAILFLKYGTHGAGFLEEWLSKDGWQQYLWKKIFSDRWTYPVEVCQEEFDFPHPLHLFGFSTIAPIFRSFFKQLNSTFYLLSPSPLFLGDICTDRQRLYVGKIGEKRDVALSERRELEGYLNQTNRIVANSAKLKRETLSLLEEETSLIEERYVEPESRSLLQSLQSDLFHLSNPCKEGAQRVADCSLEVHATPSMHREVEVLRDNIVRLVKGGVALKEIVVLSPQIDAYLPYIEAEFGADELPIPFRMTDCKKIASDSFGQGFMHFLSLKEGRFEKEEVLKLFSCHAFSEKVGLDEKESELFCSWIRESKLLWGFDGHHRNAVLESDHAEVETGTWEWAFDRLLWGLAVVETGEEELDSSIAPLGVVSWTDAEILGKGIGAIKQIKERFDRLETKKSFSDWISLLKELASTFFEKRAEGDTLFEGLEQISKALKESEEPLFPFSSLVRLVSDYFESKKGSHSSSNLEVVSFHALKEGRLRSANSLFLLGMQEGAFPRKESKNPFLDGEFLKKSQAPSVNDEERTLFFDTLLLAKSSLVISYLSVSPEDGKEVPPSLLIQELLAYLEEEVGIKREDVETTHPTFAFDERTFESPIHYSGAQSLYKAPLRKPLSFFTEGLKEKERAEVISLTQLLKCARHPIQYFLNANLGIYCDWADRSDEEFVLSPLEKARLRQDSLKMPFEELIEKAQNRGTLPLWQFHDVATASLEEELSEYHDALRRLSVDPSALFTIELTLHLKEPKVISDRLLHLPALELRDGVKIVGKLSDISEKGMLFHGKDSIEDRAKVWPKLLVYLCLEHEWIQEKRLLLTKTGKEKSFSIENPALQLAKYIDYFDRCSREVSLFMPRWADTFIKGDEAALEAKMKAAENELLRSRGDPYLEWFFMREKELDVRAHCLKMAPQIRELGLV